MEWWGYLTSGIGVAGGIYGAWRSWKTERRLKPSLAPWIVRHHQGVVFEIRSNLPHMAYDVRADVVGHAVLESIEGDASQVPPGAFVLARITARLTAPANILIVQWRQGATRRLRTARLLIPPVD